MWKKFFVIVIKLNTKLGCYTQTVQWMRYIETSLHTRRPIPTNTQNVTRYHFKMCTLHSVFMHFYSKIVYFNLKLS